MQQFKAIFLSCVNKDCTVMILIMLNWISELSYEVIYNHILNASEKFQADTFENLIKFN